MNSNKKPGGGRLPAVCAVLAAAALAFIACTNPSGGESGGTGGGGVGGGGDDGIGGGSGTTPTTTVYYWVNEQNKMTLTQSGTSITQTDITRTQNVTIAAQGFGYTAQRWYIDGVEDTAKAGQATYVFRGAERVPGSHTVGLRVSGGGAYHYAEFTVTVTY